MNALVEIDRLALEVRFLDVEDLDVEEIESACQQTTGMLPDWGSARFTGRIIDGAAVWVAPLS